MRNNQKIGLRKFGIFGIPLVAVFLAAVLLFTNFFGSTAVEAKNLMEGITPSKVDEVEISDDFVNSGADFSMKLFKESITPGKNSMISPLSVYIALAMTANGADGKTLEEFESVLGKFNLTMEDINKYCYSYGNYLKDVENVKLKIANSIWYRDDESLTVNRDFLQTNADFYDSGAYKADFDSKETVDDINNWVKNNTNNLIDKIVDSISKDTVMYLINTLYFEGEWENPYNKNDVRSGEFVLEGGEKVSTEFMYSSESYYLKDDMAEGFLKPYKDSKYSFAALLPQKGMSVEQYAAALTGEKFISLIKNKEGATVNAGLPKFKSEYSIKLVEPLKTIGLKDCFDENSANFSRMGSSDFGNLFVGDILHKTFIQVDELGTKAGAVTKVEMPQTSAPMDIKNVILDRPFVYAIVDNETGLPLFIGIVQDPR